VSSEGLLFRFLLGLSAGLAAAALVAGCAIDGRSGGVLGAGQAESAWATPVERSWLGKLGRWNASVTAASCSAGLAQVGPAPSRRLERALEVFRQACSRLEQGREAFALLLQADQMLPPGELSSLPVVAGDVDHSRIEPRFSRIAGALAAKTVEVRCWSTGDWLRLMHEEHAYTGGLLGKDTLGFAGINGARVNLAPEICDSLAALTYRRVRPADEGAKLMLGAAVVTLTHEAQHSSGVVAEAVAECRAIQLAHRTAMQLGANPASAASLVRAYWRQYDRELPAYRSGECRRGGALDLGLADSIWR
jgi:hypothetical protein